MTQTTATHKASEGKQVRYWAVSLIFFAVLVIAMIPYAINGTNSVVVAHDHLDANFVWATVLAKQGLVFASADTVVPQFLAGLERHFFGSPIQLYYWTFMVLPPFQAMVAVEGLTRAIAFIGAFLFAKDFLFFPSSGPASAGATPRRGSDLLAALAAASFALLPFWPPGGAAVAGVPWFFWAALCIRSGGAGKVRVALIGAGAILFVLFGSLVLSGLFALAFTSIVIVNDLVRRLWKQAIRLFVFNSIVTLLFALQNIDLIGIFSSSAPTTRHAMVRAGIPSDMLGIEIVRNFFAGQYHAFPGVIWPMLAAVVLALAVGGLASLMRSWRWSKTDYQIRTVLTGLAAIFFTALCYGMWRWSLVQDLIRSLELAAINFGRFHWLQPGLWFVTFAAALAFIWSIKSNPYTETEPPLKTKSRFNILGLGPWVATILACSQIALNAMALPIYRAPDQRLWHFEAFLAPSLFDKIRTRLGPQADTARLGLIGAHPAIAQFNGFKTMGGYLQVYPLETKNAFRQIIAAELDKSAKFKAYFDDWGSRAYLFAADLEECVGACTADRAPERISVDLDMTAFRKFGGTHLLSVSRIENAVSLGILEIGTFESSDSNPNETWRFHLYALE